MIKGRYEVLETLGAGGEARVVKALDHQHDRVVALKIRSVASERDRDELLGEARILLALPPHPALPVVREDFFDGDRYILAMDWVDGTDLGGLLRDRGRPGLAPSSVLGYLAQAAEALAHLHSQNPPVIHGDVKPANLILTTGGRIKLVDFGVSSTPTAARSRFGTPGYTAPELASGAGLSRASDVYAFAATAFALLTGAPPAGALPSWEGIDRERAAQLEAALRIGLSIDSAHRAATPGELVERLRVGWGATLPTGLITFCMSDIEGSMRLWQTSPVAMAEALVRHDELITDCVEASGGSLIESMGDGDSTFSVFDSAPGAVEAALAATRALAAETWPSGIKIAARWGIHTGEAERRDGSYIGPHVGVAARLRDQADGGQIFLSSATAELVAGHLPAGCELVDLGPHRLRGLTAPERIRALYGPGVSAPLPVTDCPYRGLLAFEASDRSYFFGREPVVRELLARLEPGRLLAVVGASGSGKSSVLRAGLAGAALAGEVDGVGHVAVITPGSAPRLDVRDGALVVVDQFEELFTLCGDDNARQAFISALLARDPPVVIGMRADLYGQLAGYPELARAVAGNQILLGAMTADELRRAVEQPARLAGLRLEPGLVDLVLRDVAGQPGALPLLSHALRETWERRDGRTLTVEAYRTTGGVASALAQTADSVVAALPVDGQRLARNVFVRLTELGEDAQATRRRVAVDELVHEGASPDAVGELLERLADARLVTLGDGTAEVAHEVLIREWPALRGWLDEDREGIRLRRTLGTAARAWDAGGREPSDLYRGARLAAAADSARELNAVERAFLDASIADAERGRRSQLRVNRRLRGLLAAAVLLLLVAAGAALIARNAQSTAQAQALHSDAERLGATALTAPSIDRSLLLAVAGVKLYDSPLTRSYLFAALQRSPAAIGVMRGAGNPLTALDVSPDGKTVAAGDDRGDVLFFDAAGGRREGEPYTLPHAAPVSAVKFSPDGTRLAVVGNDFVDILDGRTHRYTRRLFASPPSGPSVNARLVVGTVAFAPDSRVLAADVIHPGPRRTDFIVRWDAQTGRQLGRPRQVPGPARPQLVGFLARGTQLVTTSTAGDTTIIRNGSSLRPVRSLRGGGSPSALSPDGRVVAIGSSDGTVRLLDLRTGRLRVANDRHDGAVTDLRFTPDSRTLLTAGSDGHVIRWNVAGGRRVETFTGDAGSVSGVAIAPDGKTAYTAGADGDAIAWDLAGGRRLDRPFTAPPWHGIVFSPDERGTGPTDLAPLGSSVPYSGLAVAATPDGRSFAVPDDLGYVDVFDSRSLALVRRIPVRPGTQVSAVAIAPDGRTAAATTATGQLRFAELHGALGPIQQAYRLAPVAWALAFSGDGRWLATAGEPDPTLRLWNVHRRTVVSTSVLSPYGGSGPAVAGNMTFSPDGAQLAAVANDGIGGTGIDILSVPQLTELKTLRAPAGKAVDFSPDGRLLVFGDDQGRVWLYDTRTWRLARPPLAAHNGAVNTVDISPDGHTLATTSVDGTTRVWDLRSRRPIGDALPGLAQHDLAAAFVDDGKSLVTLQDDGQGHLWDIQPRSWARRACRVAGRALTRAEWSDALPDRAYSPVCAAR